ncbi:hypothetical protein ACU4GD_20810 [Cupriavidus basilensis]
MLAVEQGRDLAQHVVLEFVGFPEGCGKGEYAGDQRNREDGERQPEREAKADRILQSAFETIHPTPLTFLMALLPSFLRKE